MTKTLWKKTDIKKTQIEEISILVFEALKSETFFCLWLQGPVGAGKTTFVGYLLHAFGLPKEAPVNSPTFTYLNDYKLNKKTFAHLDFYRMEANDNSAITDLLTYNDYDGYFLEWPENVKAKNELLAPTHLLEIIEESENSRSYIFSKRMG